MSPGDEAFASVLVAAKSGADWAWSSLFQELFGPVTGYLASRGAAEPEDTASEVFLKVARKIHDFDGDRDSFRSWVFVIAHRSLIDDRRHRSRRPDLAAAIPDGGYAGGDVEEEAVESLVTAELIEAFERLTDTQRDVLALRMVAGLSLQQTAEVLGKRTGAVKALQHRALTTLKKELDLSHVSK